MPSESLCRDQDQVCTSLLVQKRKSRTEPNVDWTTHKDVTKRNKTVVRNNINGDKNEKRLSMEWTKAIRTRGQASSSKRTRELKGLLSDDIISNMKLKDKHVKNLNKSIDAHSKKVSNNLKLSRRSMPQLSAKTKDFSVVLSSVKKGPISTARVAKTRRRLSLAAYSQFERQKNFSPFTNDKIVTRNVIGHDNSKSATPYTRQNVSSSNKRHGLKKFSKSTKMDTNLPKAKSSFRNLRSTMTFICDTVTVSHKNSCASDACDVIEIQTNKTISNKTLKDSTCSVKVPRVQLQRLKDIITPIAQRSSLIKIRVSDQFTNINLILSRKTYNFIVHSSQKAQKLHDKRSKSTDKQQLDKTSHTLQENNTTCLSPILLNENVVNENNLSHTKKASFTSSSSTPKSQEKLEGIYDKYKTQRRKRSEGNITSELKAHGAQSITRDTDVDIDEDGKQVTKNDTYELIEPKTPDLQRKMEKHFDESNITKRSLRVQFLSSLQDFAKTRRCVKQNKGETINNGNRQKSIVANNVSPAISISGTSTKTLNKHNLLNNVNMSSMSKLKTPIKKQASKGPCMIRNVPNFAGLHKRLFAKSESILDAKKRVENKHTAYSAVKINTLLRSKATQTLGDHLPSKPDAKVYNRYGFRIRRQLQLGPTLRSNNLKERNRQQNLAFLKGVRTNRRFELQMKARNLNL